MSDVHSDNRDSQALAVKLLRRLKSADAGVFDSATPVTSTDPAGDGTLTIEFADCTEGLVTYAITSLGTSGEIPIQRISLDNVPLCESFDEPQMQAR